MTKKDRERLENIERHHWVENGHKGHNEKVFTECSKCFLLSIINKQDKVMEVAKDLDTWYQAGGMPEELEVALYDVCERNHAILKDLDAESPQRPPRS